MLSDLTKKPCLIAKYQVVEATVTPSSASDAPPSSRLPFKVPLDSVLIRAHSTPSIVSKPSSVLTLFMVTKMSPPPVFWVTESWLGHVSPGLTGRSGRSGKNAWNRLERSRDDVPRT